MNAPVKINNAVSMFSPQEMALIQGTVAKDCNRDEFDQFLHVCANTKLDPLRKQIYALVYNKKDASKRQMSIIIGIDGYTAIAARTGDYRPDDRPTRFEIDSTLIDPLKNPKGLVSAEVTVFKFVHGEWFPTTVTADWDEYAPLKDIWEYDQDAGKKLPSGKFYPLEGKWKTMPKRMLEKCAEAKALRRAWPDQFAGTNSEAEADKMWADIDLTPSDYAEQAAVENRLEMINGKDSLLFDFQDDRGLMPVPFGEVHDRICEHIQNATPEQALAWRDHNRHAMQDFWARNKSDALDIKKRFEAIEGRLQKAD